MRNLAATAGDFLAAPSRTDMPGRICPYEGASSRSIVS